jgi:hypothetical protein
VLWEKKYRFEYQKICKEFLIPLYNLLFCTLVPCMTRKSLAIVCRVGDWYMLEYNTYIRINKTMKSPHILPKFIFDRLVLQEISYQTMIHGVGPCLYRDKKEIWAPFSLWVGSYSLKEIKESQAKMNTLAYFHFEEERSFKHDPSDLYSYNYKYMWTYESKTWEEEEVHHTKSTYDELFFIRGRISQHRGRR